MSSQMRTEHLIGKEGGQGSNLIQSQTRKDQESILMLIQQEILNYRIRIHLLTNQPVMIKKRKSKFKWFKIRSMIKLLIQTRQSKRVKIKRDSFYHLHNNKHPLPKVSSRLSQPFKNFLKDNNSKDRRHLFCRIRPNNK